MYNPTEELSDPIVASFKRSAKYVPEQLGASGAEATKSLIPMAASGATMFVPVVGPALAPIVGALTSFFTSKKKTLKYCRPGWIQGPALQGRNCPQQAPAWVDVIAGLLQPSDPNQQAPITIVPHPWFPGADMSELGQSLNSQQFVSWLVQNQNRFPIAYSKAQSVGMIQFGPPSGPSGTAPETSPGGMRAATAGGGLLDISPTTGMLLLGGVALIGIFMYMQDKKR